MSKWKIEYKPALILDCMYYYVYEKKPGLFFSSWWVRTAFETEGEARAFIDRKKRQEADQKVIYID